jgi:phage terminase large subunit
MPTIEIAYKPREAFKPFHARTERWAELICHRRAGKTVAAINDLQRRCLTLVLPKDQAVNPPRFAFMAPTRVRAKDIAWQYLKRFSQPIPGIKVSESELFVEYPNGGRVTIYGADNDRGMGLYLDGIVFDECDEIPPSVDDVVMPALSDRKGWTVHMGILRGRHNLWKRYEKYRGASGHFQLLLRASETGIIDPQELASLKSHMGEVAFAMQMEADTNVSIANAIYGPQMDTARREGRIGSVAFDPTVPIDFFFDIGHSIGGDDWSVWAAQMQNRDIMLQQYFAKTGELPSYYAGKCLVIANNNNLTMGTVFLPHDGSRKDRQGRTAEDDLRAAGIPRIKIVPRTPVLWDSINHLRGLFPRLHFNSVRCGETWSLGEMEMPSGLDCCDYYTKKEDATSGLITDVPVHDQYSHGADALRTLAEAHRLGMIDGTSFTAREARHTNRQVIRADGLPRPTKDKFRRHSVFKI